MREAQIHSFLFDPLSNIEHACYNTRLKTRCYLNCTSAENEAISLSRYETSGEICHPRQRTALKLVKFRTEQRRSIFARKQRYVLTLITPFDPFSFHRDISGYQQLGIHCQRAFKPASFNTRSRSYTVTRFTMFQTRPF